MLRDGQSVKVEPRAWRVLEHLARFRHRAVTKEELLAALRLKGAVSEESLRQAVRAARLAIGDNGPESALRTVPRVGYILDVAPASAPGQPPARLPLQGMPSVIIGPLRDETGRPSLQWATRGLVACMALGLALDTSLQIQQAQSLEASWPRRHAEMLQLLHAAGARYAVLGLLRPDGRDVALDLQIHADGEETVIPIRAASWSLRNPVNHATRHRTAVRLQGAGDSDCRSLFSKAVACALRPKRLPSNATTSAAGSSRLASTRLSRDGAVVRSSSLPVF